MQPFIELSLTVLVSWEYQEINEVLQMNTTLVWSCVVSIFWDISRNSWTENC